MATPEEFKNKILRLEKKWQPNRDARFPWAPFGDDMVVERGSLPPHERLVEVRARPPIVMPLAGPSTDVLRTVWNGDAATLSDAPFFHQYAIAASPAQYWDSWRRHPGGQALHSEGRWACDNLRDAGEKYSWSGSLLDFPLLALALQTAVARGDELRAAAVCLRILDWGGVLYKPGRMKDWLFERAFLNELCRSLVDATARLIPQSSESTDCFDGSTYLMNSSSTKLYAAMSLDLREGVQAGRQDVLIYDARVAAALAFITRIVLARSGATTLPDAFRFPVEKNPEARRDPSCATFEFPRFSTMEAGHRDRAKFARIGSRIIQQMLDLYRPSTEFALAEKGLFMLGYDVRDVRQIASGTSADTAVVETVPAIDTGSEVFKRRAVELHKAGRTQGEAILEAAKQFKIDLSSSYTASPGSHFGRWRKQGYV